MCLCSRRYRVRKERRVKLTTFSAVLPSLILLSTRLSLGAAVGLPDTTENIHLGLMSDVRVPNLSILAGKVDYIFGAATSAGVPPAGIYLDGYLTYDRDDSYNRTLSWFLSNHPNWIVYTCDKQTVAYEWGPPNVPIDITNSAVLNYQMQEVSSSFSSVPPGFAYNGMGWDNVSLVNWVPRCGTWQGSTWTPLYGGQGAYVDPLYVNSVVSWAQDIYTMLQTQFPGKGMTMNLSSGPTGVSNPLYVNASALYPYLDIVFDERGFTGYGSGPITDGDWENTVVNLELLNQQNKAFFLSNEWNNVPDDQSITHAQINWSLGNYLLVKGQHSYVYIYPIWQGVQGYGNFYDRPEYHVPIGHAISARYTYDGVQRRDYSGGMALVNPSSTATYTVTLPSTYTDLWGNRLSSLTMAPATAEVLLSTGSTPPLLQLNPASPGSGSGLDQTFSFSISDNSGYRALSDIAVMINATYTDGTDTCWLHYYQPSNVFQISYDNTPSSLSWQPAVALGTNLTEQNSQCSVNISGVTASGSGNTLTLSVPIIFTSSWSGMKNVYVYARDQSGATVGYTAEGSWSVP
jgi:hypothetical protein